VGLARFQKALDSFEQHDQVDLLHRSFELDPSLPRGQVSSVLDSLQRKFGSTRDQILAMEGRMASMAAAEGLGYVADRPTGNTYDAHQLLHLAIDRGLGDVVRSALWQAHFAAGRSVFTAEDLSAIVVPAGLDEAEVKQVLAEDTYWEAVRTDEQRAARLGITGVPFFVLGDVSSGDALGISGAQSTERFVTALQQRWAE
jgi:predicted DsbA family dithiol-disulfide isomerase